MQANELRVGNWVKHHLNRHKWQITVSDFNEEYITGQAFFHMAPIPLTPGILEKAGFVPDGAYYSHSNLNIERQLTNTGDEILIAPNIKYANSIKYVHQLQNLYYSLTDEELEINL